MIIIFELFFQFYIILKILNNFFKIKYFTYNMNFIIYIFYIKFTLIYCYQDHAHYYASILLDSGKVIFISSNESSSTDNKNYVALKQFPKEDGRYTIYISKTKHYIYDTYGNSLLKKSISNSLYNRFYSIVPYSHLSNEFYYYVIYFNNATQIKFTKYSYYLTENEFKNNSFNSNNILGNEKNLITCQLMKNSNGKVISCFF